MVVSFGLFYVCRKGGRFYFRFCKKFSGRDVVRVSWGRLDWRGRRDLVEFDSIRCLGSGRFFGERGR